MDSCQGISNPYAGVLGSRSPLSVLGRTTRILSRLVGDVSPSRLILPARDEGRSIRDILCHLADTEIVFAFRLRQALAQEHPGVHGVGQEPRTTTSVHATSAEAVALFDTLRMWNLRLINAIDPAETAKPIQHPDRGVVTLADIVDSMASHDIKHCLQIARILMDQAEL